MDCCLSNRVWLFVVMVFRIKPAGDPPSPRAAHAAATVGTMVVFQVLWDLIMLRFLFTCLICFEKVL